MQSVTIGNNISNNDLFSTIMGFYLFSKVEYSYFIINRNLFSKLSYNIELNICRKQKNIDNVIYQYQSFFHIIIDHDNKTDNKILCCSLSDVELLSRSKKLNKLIKKLKFNS